MSVFDPLLAAAPGVLTPMSILAMVLGTAMGLMVGAMPGLTVTTGIAVLIPFTFGLDPLVALGLMAGMYNGGSYGGAITAILLRVPGTPASVATVLDGYPLAQSGRAGYALQVAVVSGTIGSVLSALALILLAPPLARVSLLFGPAEYFWVAMFGLATVAVLLGDDPPKGLLSAALGLMLGTVGQDLITGAERYTFDILELVDGFSIVVLLTGLYALPPVFMMAEEAVRQGMPGSALRLRRAGSVLAEWRRFLPVWLRSSLIGIVVGVMPGAAGSITSLIAYNEAKRRSAEPESFGKGNPEGVAASEAGNGADNAAALVPALTLGIPGSGVAAVILGGLLVHGLRPGPQLFREAPEIVYGFMLQMLVTAMLLLLLGGLAATRLFGQVLRLPPVVLAPAIAVITAVGVFAVNNSVFDLGVLFAIGLVGYAMERLDYPTAPAVLGMLLGPMAEQQLRLALTIGLGDPAVLVANPASWAVIALTLLVLASPWLRRGKTVTS
ncbi:tripartite tricarboxylate transporter permease [Elioraea sp.]|uniref:tripartite tricarboxylate transporter permease n=1 Tax=Elioraea sp. TaxID=2185103 RepID=UPI0021DCC136|nr:tripartite tricarboxylate transporter permease [Elioraea sp.]GIX09277.1 MAG: C4-dicarboxylate ABC transporter permease [Elioraea sp.]